MNKKLKNVPRFKNEDEERKFWEQADSSEYFDFDSAELAAFPNLKLTRQPISLRLTKSLSLIKLYLEKAVDDDYYHLAL